MECSETQLDTFVLSLPAVQLKIESRVWSKNVSLTSSDIMPSKGLTPFICLYRGYRWPPGFSVSPHCVQFSSSLLFGNRSPQTGGLTVTQLHASRMLRTICPLFHQVRCSTWSFPNRGHQQGKVDSFPLPSSEHQTTPLRTLT